MSRAALVLAVLLCAGGARAGREAERCRAAVQELREAGRSIDGTRGMPVEEARLFALARLDAARLAESGGEPRLRLPWLESVRAEGERDPTSRDAAERLFFAAERLAAACALLEAPPAPAPELERSRLAAILARPEYDLRSRDEQFLARLLQRVWTWFRDVFAQSETVQRAAFSTRAAFLGAVGLAVAWLAWRLARSRRSVRREEASPGAAPLALDDPRSYDASAASALARGDGRDAMRCALLGVLASLERSRLAAPGRAATNREVAGQVARRGGPAALVDSVSRLAEAYDRAWYGLAWIEPDEARRFVASARALSDEAARARPREAA